MDKQIIENMLKQYYIKSKNLQIFLEKYTQIWVIKDTHYSTYLNHQQHFNIKFFNDITNEISLMIHANIDDNYNITSLTQISTIC